MKDFVRINLPGDDHTKFLIELQHDGLWSGGPEICIVREFNGKRDRLGPSIPITAKDDLVRAIEKVYDNFMAKEGKS